MLAPVTSVADLWLVVEDNDDDFFLFRRACAFAFDPQPLIHREIDGMAAKQFLSNNAETPWLVISDLKMPNMDGLELLQWVRNQAALREVRFIMLSNSNADMFLFPAREQGTQRLGLFIIERNTPGVTITDQVDLTTEATVSRLVLDHCKVPNEQLVGYEYEAGKIIASEQLNIAARSLGIGMRCLAGSIEHAHNRVTFGRRLAERQAIQWMLADLSLEIRTCTWLTLEAAWRCDQELTYFEEAALAKKRAAKMAFQAADTAIQIHGGYGVCRDLPFEGFYRDARLMRLLFGREQELDRTAGEKFLRQ